MFTRQPQFAARIDTQRFKDIAILVSPGALWTTNIVNQRAPAISGSGITTGAIAPSERTIAFSGSQTNNLAWYGSGHLDGATGCTVVFRFRANSVASAFKPFAAWGSSNIIIPLEVEAGGGSLSATNDFSIQDWDAIGVPNFVANKTYTVVFRLTLGSPPTLWIDGIRYNGGTSMSSGTFPSGDPWTLGCSTSEDAQLPGHISFAMLARRAYNDSLCRQLSLNPWQVFVDWRQRDAIDAPATGITGTLSSTLAAATLSSTGTVAIAGTLSQTLSAATLSATGTIALAGTLTQTLSAASLSATGALAITGALTATLGAATLEATGAADALAGTLSATLADATLSAPGTLAISGLASQTLAAATLSSASTITLSGALTQTLGNVTLVADSFIAGSVEGTLSVTLDSLRLFAEGIDPNRRNTGAGTTRKKRRKQYVEIDGQDFEVSGPEEAIALLERAKALVTQAIEKTQTSVRVRPGITRPRIRTTDPELRPIIRQAQADITKLYDDAIRDFEIRALMAQADEEEEAIIRLLM